MNYGGYYFVQVSNIEVRPQFLNVDLDLARSMGSVNENQNSALVTLIDQLLDWKDQPRH